MKTSTFEKQSISSLQLITSLQGYAIVASNLSSSQTVEMSICSWLQESPSLASSTIHISAGSGA